MTDVIGDKDARRWAQQWADEWNRHDVDAVLEHFASDVDVDDVHVGGGCLAILYRNQTGRRVTEVMVFGTDGKVTRGYALYAPA